MVGTFHEIEKTYLIKKLPDLGGAECIEILDVYFPQSEEHPVLRLRKRGDVYEMTKKQLSKEDPSQKMEFTLPLSREEFLTLSQAPGKRVSKKRYKLACGEYLAEIDVFQEDLEGLMMVDFEFESLEQRDRFTPPDFCGVELTAVKEFAGGMVCGKHYKDLKPLIPQSTAMKP